MLKGCLLAALLVACMAIANGDRKRAQSTDEIRLLALRKAVKSVNPVVIPSNSIDATHKVDTIGQKRKSQVGQGIVKVEEKKSTQPKQKVSVDKIRTQPIHTPDAKDDKKEVPSNGKAERKYIHSMKMNKHWSQSNSGFSTKGQGQMGQSEYSFNKMGDRKRPNFNSGFKMKNEGMMSQSSHVSNKMGGRPNGSFRVQNEGKYSQSGQISNPMGGKSWSHSSSTFKVQNNGGYKQPSPPYRKMGDRKGSKSDNKGRQGHQKSGYVYNLLGDQKGSSFGIIKVLGINGNSKYNHEYGLMSGRKGILSNGVLKVGLLSDRKKKKSSDDSSKAEEPIAEIAEENVEIEDVPATVVETKENVDRKREQSDEPETATMKVEVIVDAEDAKLDNDTDDIDNSNETESVEVSSAAAKHPPRHHTNSAKRGDIWYLRPNYQGRGWIKSVRAHSRRNFPSSYKNNGRWWYYKGSVKRDRTSSSSSKKRNNH